MGSELVVSLEQEQVLPLGYQENHWDTLTELDSRLQTLPEWLMGILIDETTGDLETDDENGAHAIFIPADDNFPCSVYISAADLKEPERREEIVNKIRFGFKDLMDRLPHLYLSFQFPPPETLPDEV